MNDHFLLPDKSYSSLAQYQEEKGDALTKARSLSSQEIIQELRSAGLRGRGGAGFPTALKWQTLYEDPCETKYVVVNAAEGEPGTFKDRMLLRKNPFALIEGTLIAAHVLKTSDIYICLKGSFHPEISRVYEAINDFEKMGYLEGMRISVVGGPEDYLYGEEKALLNVIEGIGPLPREAHYPPYVIGLFSTPQSPNPALVNNVETYSRVPQIILKGAESFSAIGTENTKGPFICTVSGDVKEEGVFEVTPGITLRELLYHYAKGPREGHEFKLVINGVSSSVIKAQDLDVRLDYDDFSQIGSWLGSCSFIVYDNERSAARIAEEVALFLYDESCNQCPACKGGLKVSYQHLKSLFTEEQDPSLLQRVINGAKSAPRENRCYLPVQGSIIIPSLVEAFREEFEALLGEHSRALPSQVVLPKLSDFDPLTRRFIHKGHVAHEPGDMPWKDERSFMDLQNYSR